MTIAVVDKIAKTTLLYIHVKISIQHTINQPAQAAVNVKADFVLYLNI